MSKLQEPVENHDTCTFIFNVSGYKGWQNSYKKNMALLRIVWWRNKRADFHLPVLDLNKQHENPILFHYKMLKETITMIVSLWVT